VTWMRVAHSEPAMEFETWVIFRMPNPDVRRIVDLRHGLNLLDENPGQKTARQND